MKHIDENWVALVFVVIAIVTCGVLGYQKQANQHDLEMQKTTQQAKIDAQSREINRLEQTNKALANQANENKGE